MEGCKEVFLQPPLFQADPMSAQVLFVSLQLNPASLPNLDLCQHGYFCSHTAKLEELCSSHLSCRDEIQAQDLNGNKILPWISTGVFFLSAVSWGPWKPLSLCMTPSREESEIEASWYSRSTRHDYLENFQCLPAHVEFQKGSNLDAGFSVQYGYLSWTSYCINRILMLSAPNCSLA